MVTDRRRLTSGDRTFSEQQRSLLALIAEAMEGGVSLVVIRELDLRARDLWTLSAAAVILARGSATRVLVNGHADVALAAGADGVHLPANGPAVARVRALGPPGWLVGRSAHSADELAAAASADYVTFGTVFPTASKPGVAGQGVAALAAAARSVHAPVLAIGGVTIERAGECLAAGAVGVAAISLFMPAASGGLGPREVVRQLRAASDAH